MASAKARTSSRFTGKETSWYSLPLRDCLSGTGQSHPAEQGPGHRQHDAGDVVGVLARQEQVDTGNVLRLAVVAEADHHERHLRSEERRVGKGGRCGWRRES